MQGEGGFVKDYRSTVDWEWFTDPKTAHLWEYIRLRANYEPSRFRGMEIGRGEFLESLPMIALRTGLSVKSVRTALEHLESTGEVACKPTRFGMLISVLKYALYQDQASDSGTQLARQPAGNRQATGMPTGMENGRESATYKESKEYKEVKKERREREASAPPTREELQDYIQEIGSSVDPDRFFDYYENNGWKTGKTPMQDWRATVRSWEKRDKEKAQRGRRDEVMPDYWNADPIRDKDPKLATPEEIERVRAMLIKGKGERFR